MAYESIYGINITGMKLVKKKIDCNDIFAGFL
jgi:hypothetical protein